MKQFYSIADALSYREQCPICQGHTKINYKGLNIERRHDGNYLILEISCGSGINEMISINMKTNHVESNTAIDSYDYELDLTKPFSIYQSHPNYGGGTHYQGVAVSCDNCFKYKYVVQIKFDLGKRELIGAYINSESITIEDDPVVYEIVNVYTTNKTEYFAFSPNQDAKKAILPLIPLNFDDPQETLSRIKSLLIFS